MNVIAAVRTKLKYHISVKLSEDIFISCKWMKKLKKLPSLFFSISFDRAIKLWSHLLGTNRSSPRRCYIKKSVIRYFAKHTCSRVSFLIKLQASGLVQVLDDITRNTFHCRRTLVAAFGLNYVCQKDRLCLD